MPTNPDPIRCFQGNAQPHEPFWKFINADQSQSGQTELELNGVISEFSWMGDEITPQLFKDELYRVGNGGPILMKINSPGGDVIAASRMRAIMTDYPGAITTRVEGVAASAAVIVAIAGKQVQMTDASYMMIHDPAVVVFLAALNIDTLGKLRDDLKTIKDGIVPAYAAKTGMAEDKIARMMSNETWMSARQALDYGFADEIISGGQQPAKSQLTNLAYVNVLQSYGNVPPGLLNSSSESTPVVDVERIRNLERLRGRVSQHIRNEGEK